MKKYAVNKNNIETPIFLYVEPQNYSGDCTVQTPCEDQERFESLSDLIMYQNKLYVKWHWDGKSQAVYISGFRAANPN